MTKSMTKSENKYHDLPTRSQRKDGKMSKTFAFDFHHSI